MSKIEFESTKTNDDSDSMAHGTLASGSTVVPWKIHSNRWGTTLTVWADNGSLDLELEPDEESDIQLARDLMSVIRAAIRSREEWDEKGEPE